MTRSARSAADPAGSGRCERGAGLFGLVGALVVFLGLLLVATHVLFHLYARSVVTSTAEAAVRRATRFTDGASCPAVADAAVGQLLHDLGDAAAYTTATAECSVDVLRVHVVVRPPTALPRFAAGLGLDEIDRTVEVRVEGLRP